MSSKWDKKYLNSVSPNEPCAVLSDNLHLLPANGSSMDVACGLGGNALLLAQLGLESYACDSSAVALEKLGVFAQQQKLRVNCELKDFEVGELSGGVFELKFDVIVVSHYLYRPLMPWLVEGLNVGGLLFFQTFSQNKLSDSGPGNPEYLLQPQELLSEFAELDLRYYKDDDRAGVDSPDGSGVDRDRVYYVGQKKG